MQLQKNINICSRNACYERNKYNHFLPIFLIKQNISPILNDKRTSLIREFIFRFQVHRQSVLCIPKLRTSNHDLRIETGRWQQIPVNERLCEKCTTGKIGNEVHFLIGCPKYHKERNQFVTDILKYAPNFNELSNKHKFFYSN